MLEFCLTIHHLWGRVLARFPLPRAVAYADGGYIKAKLNVALQVLPELKRILKEDAGLELNVTKTSVLPKGFRQQEAFDVAHKIIGTIPDVAHLSADVVLDSFCPVGFVGIGVPIGTDVFVLNFVAKTCRAIIDDVEKLDAIQDGFIHYQLLSFARPPVSNILTLIFCSVIVAFSNITRLFQNC
jgi:hypothetical protein